MSQDALVMLVLWLGGLTLALTAGIRDLRLLRRMRDSTRASAGATERGAAGDATPTGRLMEDGLSGTIHVLLVAGSLLVAPGVVTWIGEAFGVKVMGLLGREQALRIYAFFLDGGAFALVLGAALGLFRRWMMRPKHVQPGLQADVVLSAFGFWGLSILLLEGVRVVGVYASVDRADLPSHLDAFGPIGLFLGDVFRAGGMTDYSGESGRMAYWLTQVALVFLVVLVPRTRLTHMVFAHSSLRKSGQLPGHALVLRREGDGARVVDRFGHLGEKAAVDFLACAACGRCERACPTSLADMELRPGVIQARGVVGLRANGTSMSKGEEPAGTLLEWVGDKAVWQCTTCRACEASCPLGIHHVGRTVELRRSVVAKGGTIPPEIAAGLKGMEEVSNPGGLKSGTRGEWALDAGVPRFDATTHPEYLLFLGCQSAFGDGAGGGMAVVRLLKAAGISFGVLGAEEGCCGDIALRSGNEELFRRLALENLRVFQAHGITKIITLCPHGYHVLKNEYSQLSGGLQVEHHTEVLSRALVNGHIVPNHVVNMSVVVHDACYLGRYNNLYAPIRVVLDGIPGTRRVEIRQSKTEAVCCGGGGGMRLVARQRDLLGSQRWTQLCEASCDLVVTACPACRDTLGAAKGSSRVGGEVKDVAEVLSLAVFGPLEP